MSYKETQAVILPGYHDNVLRSILSLHTENIRIPGLREDEVLVKIFAAPCNPSDIAFLRGGYNVRKTLPAIPGFEGSGDVVDTGKNPGAGALLGKRVSCFSQSDRGGTWAGYLVTAYGNCLPLKEKMDMEQAACFSINPFTAFGLMEIAEKNHSGSVIVNAAGSQVAEYIRIFAAEKMIKVINVVRKADQVEILKEQGQDFVLHSGSEDYFSRLKELAYDLRATTVYDAVGGAQTALFFHTAPPGSGIVLYGGLSGEPVNGINPMEVIFQGKKLTGFNLNAWISGKDPGDLAAISEALQERFISGRLKAAISRSYPLTEVKEALKYYIKNMSSGKILLQPGL